MKVMMNDLSKLNIQELEDLLISTREDVENGLTQSSMIPIEDRIIYTETVKKLMNESNVVVLE